MLSPLQLYLFWSWQLQQRSASSPAVLSLGNLLFHMVEVCNLMRSSVPYTGARGARKVCTSLHVLNFWHPSILAKGPVPAHVFTPE